MTEFFKVLVRSVVDISDASGAGLGAVLAVLEVT